MIEMRIASRNPEKWVVVDLNGGEVWEWDLSRNRWKRARDKQRLRKAADALIKKLLKEA